MDGIPRFGHLGPRDPVWHRRGADGAAVRAFHALEELALPDLGVRLQRIFLAIVPLWLDHDGLFQPAGLAVGASCEWIAARNSSRAALIVHHQNNAPPLSA